MRRLATTLVLILAALPLLAAGLPAPYAGTPGPRDYPGTDVLVLSERTDYTVAGDGRVTLAFRRAEKILTYQGMDLVGDPKVAYRKGDQLLSDFGLTTFTPDGRTVEAASNSFTEMTPFELERAPDFTSQRQMVMTKVGLDVGAVAETRYTLADQRPWRRYLNLDLLLTDGFPALERVVTLTVPDGTVLRYAVLNASAEPEVHRESGAVTYTWRFKNRPAVAMGQASHDERRLLPRLVATTCPDWKAANAHYAALADTAARATSAALDKKTDTLLKDCVTPFQKAAALAAWVAGSIPTVEWPLDSFDYSPRGASRVFESGYGNPLDKAVLLCAMLRRAGVEAAPALCAPSPSGFPDPETVPCLAQFDRVIVHADVAGNTLWIDPTAPLAESSQRDFQGFKGLPLLPGIGELHAMTPVGGEDRLLVDLRGTLGDDLSLKGEGTLLLSGSYCPYYKVQGSTEALQEYLTGFLRSVLPGAELTGHSVALLDAQQLKVTLEFKKGPVAAGKGPRSLVFDTPSESALAHLPGLHRLRREVPFLFHRTGQEEVSLDLALPDGLSPRFVPAGFSLSASGTKAVRSVSVEAGHLRVKETLGLSARVLPAAEYGAFRDLYGRWSATAERTVLF